MQGNIQNQIKALEERIAELEQQLARVQNTDKVGLNRIECRELQIVSEEGTALITLSASEESESGVKYSAKQARFCVSSVPMMRGGSFR